MWEPNSREIHPDVIIPAYRPGSDLRTLVERLKKQTLSPGRMIVMLTVDEKSRVSDVPDGCEVYTVDRREFDHAASRNEAISHSDSPVFVMMTQDAVPADRHLIENLIKGITEDGASAAYGRQLARKSSSYVEKLTRGFNYPEEPRIKTADDIKTAGIKAFFCSNACAAYDRQVFDSLGGFSAPAIFNEDMVYARALLDHGLSISYRPDARVFHSHDHSLIKLFRRNFDLAVSQKMHPEVFGDISSEGEGVRYVKNVVSMLFKAGRWYLAFGFIAGCAARYAGFKLGSHYDVLPRRAVYRFTDNPYFWKRMDHAGQ
ncbi:MAG: glycosyltransferase [Lachnospiraceae bacterium]|nr:glycosyltransferase [Lachnospiraceae bacterium]